MEASNVVELLDFLEQSGIEVYVDGGWAVDALLGEQTRSHDDLDVAVPHAGVPLRRHLMATRGFHERPGDDSCECNFVLAGAGNRRLDVHSYTLDAAGKNVGGVPYAAEHLTGTGIIAGRRVRCIDPAWLVKFHTATRSTKKIITTSACSASDSDCHCQISTRGFRANFPVAREFEGGFVTFSRLPAIERAAGFETQIGVHRD